MGSTSRLRGLLLDKSRARTSTFYLSAWLRTSVNVVHCLGLGFASRRPELAMKLEGQRPRGVRVRRGWTRPRCASPSRRGRALDLMPPSARAMRRRTECPRARAETRQRMPCAATSPLARCFCVRRPTTESAGVTRQVEARMPSRPDTLGRDDLPRLEGGGEAAGTSWPAAASRSGVGERR